MGHVRLPEAQSYLSNEVDIWRRYTMVFHWRRVCSFYM